jgi:hypothetical protein
MPWLQPQLMSLSEVRKSQCRPEPGSYYRCGASGLGTPERPHSRSGITSSAVCLYPGACIGSTQARSAGEGSLAGTSRLCKAAYAYLSIAFLRL